MFKNMKLGVQIGAGFGAVLAIFGILGMIVIGDMFGISSNAKKLNEEYLGEVEVLNQLSEDVFKVITELRVYGVNGDETYLKRGQAGLENIRKDIIDAEKLSEKYPHLKKMKEKLPLINEKEKIYETLLEKTIKLRGELNENIKACDSAAIIFQENYTQYLTKIRSKVLVDNKNGNRKEVERRIQQLNLMFDLVDDGNNIRVVNFKSQLPGNEKIIVQAEEKFEKIDKILQELKTITYSEENKRELEKISNAVEKYKNAISDIKEKMLEIQDLNKKRFDNSLELQELSELVKDTAIANIRKISDEAIKTSIFSSVKVVFGFILAIICGILLAYKLINILLSQIGKLSEWGKRIAKGDLKFEEVEETDNEIGELNKSFKEVVDSFIDITVVTKAISEGDYSKSFEERSEKDVLAKSLSIMKENLIRLNSENSRQNWLKEGQMKLSELVQGKMDIVEVSENIVTFISNYINAKVGALYVVEGTVLKLMSSFAFVRRKNISNEFKAGEGIIGQVMLEKHMITISNIPEDYISINSGLGESVPKNLVILPCKYNNEVVAVIELASFEVFTDLQLKYLELIGETIAISINAALMNTKLEDMLSKTRTQAEELQVQQEELRQTNEELEEQTTALKESEMRLQTQQEELRVSNEELQERTKELESQKDIIHEKNAHLENAQKDLERKAQELETSSKYKSEFLANMSHELRTPLNSILMLAWILSNNKEGNLNEKQIEFASTIHTSGNDLLNLINEILDLSKVESGKMELNIEPVEIKTLAESWLRLFKETANNKGLEFSVDIEKGLIEKINTDEQRLGQVVKNLLSNAVKFTSKGQIKVSMKKVPNDMKLKRAGLEAKKCIAIEVSDTGIGIPESKQMQIFEAFQQADGTTSRKYGGTGLGLSISRELVKLLGGEIKLTSKEGEGSKFTIIIPIKTDVTKISGKVEERYEQDELEVVEREQKNNIEKMENIDKLDLEIKEKEAGNKENLNEKKKILIIEDDTNFAKTIKSLAEENDFDGIIAENGEEGIEYALKYKPSAIILDIGLPKMDGYEVIETLKKNPETMSIPIHVISGRDTNGLAIKKGAISFLTKPATVEQMTNIFSGISGFGEKKVKRLLIVEDDNVQRMSISELLEGKDLEIKGTDSGINALEMMKKEEFDCIIVDLGIKDMSGFELVDEINKDSRIKKSPIIVYTGRELSKEEEMKLHKYAESIIIKGARSPERLLAETTLFLNRIGTDLNEKKRKVLKNLQSEGDSVLKDRKILVVDDDIRNIFALSSVLEENGMKIVVGRNGKEGIEKLKNTSDVELILMDIMMPEMDGYEAMKEIRKDLRYKNLPIIALTAKAMKGDKEKCIEAGANDYLPKPVETDKLISLLRVWLHK